MTIDEQIEFLTQLKAGKKVQRRPIGRLDTPWNNVSNLDAIACNFAVFEYRFEPEPMVIYANVYSCSRDIGTASVFKESCRRALNLKGKIVKFVEVIENEE